MKQSFVRSLAILLQKGLIGLKGRKNQNLFRPSNCYHCIDTMLLLLLFAVFYFVLIVVGSAQDVTPVNGTQTRATYLRDLYQNISSENL